MKEIIKKYVTGDKTRFEIAWDIRHSFDETIKYHLLLQLINTIIKKLKKGLNNGWSIDDKKVENLKGYTGIFLKKDSWNIRENGEEVPLFCLILRGDQASGLNGQYVGIEFSKSIESNSKDLLAIKDKFPEAKHYSPKIDRRPVYWQRFDAEHKDMDKKEFLVKLLSPDGIDETASYYADRLLNLKENVEAVIDDIVNRREGS